MFTVCCYVVCSRAREGLKVTDIDFDKPLSPLVTLTVRAPKVDISIL